MNHMKIGLTATVIALAMTALVGPAANAQDGQSSGISPHDRADVETHLIESNIPADQRSAILATLDSGGVLESSDDDAVPVRIDERVENGWNISMATFSDGSYRTQETEQGTDSTAKSGASTNASGVTSCSNSTAGSYEVRTGCTVRFEDSISWMSYVMDHRFVPGGAGFGQIDAVYGFKADVYYGSYGNGSVSIVKQSGNPAIAESGFDYNLNGGGGGHSSALAYVDSSGLRQGDF
ncbi:hypothetical protein [Cryobacterium sp. Y82]|uniref:hypothetical protein n=1 Tax=Cryobacterium sp. Y82 TaxID=2045017 RepID=UPI000CE3CE3F|nr:hypothetical protein [Cryobacterium sp. Y82]